LTETRLLRVTIVVLVAAVVVAHLPPRGRAEPLAIVHVGERAEAIARTRGLDANVADFLLESPGLSAHLHFIGRGQLSPLHVHPHGVEAIAVVQGHAEVTTVTRHARSVATLAPGGTAIFAPGVGHRVLDASKEAPIASLVVSLPAFEHNTYVLDEADPRISDGASLTTDFADAIADFERGTEPSRRVALPDATGALALVLVRGAAELVPAPIAIAYVLRGKGTIGGRALVAQDLAIAREHVTVQAEATLALLVATGG